LAHERTLVQIRERSFLDVLDLGLVVARRRALALSVTALAGIAPFAAFNAWILTQFSLPAFLFYALVLFEIPLSTAPLTIVLGSLMFGERPRLGRVCATLWRSAGKLLVFQGIVRAFLIASAVGWMVIPSRYAFLTEVILLERGTWRDVGKRSHALCGERGGELFGRSLAYLFFAFLFVCAFRFALVRTKNILIGGSAWGALDDYDWLGWRTQLGVWIAIAFFGVARFLTYIDQRIRLEGWEVELRLRAAGAMIGRDEKW
jgi:hypothetical protein